MREIIPLFRISGPKTIFQRNVFSIEVFGNPHNVVSEIEIIGIQ